MTTYRKTWTLMGHSMGEGFAGSSPMYKTYGFLAPFGPAGGASAGPYAHHRKHPGLKMFMSANPWPVGSATPSPPVTDIGTGAWKDITLDYVASPDSDLHPYASPYQYPSGRSIPFTPSAYAADGSGALPYSTGGGALCGLELPLAFHLSQYYGEAIYGVKLSIPSSYMLRFDAGTYAYNAYAWWSPNADFDFDPVTGRLYQRMIEKMTGAAAALPTGEKMDVRVSVMWMGDNDAGIGSTPRITNFKDAYRALIEKWRTDLVDNEWTTLPKEQIHVVIMGVWRTYGTTPIRSDMNTWMQELADEDDYVSFISTANYESLYSAGFTDTSHISHVGYYDAAVDILEAVKEVENAAFPGLDEDLDMVSVAEVRSRIRSYYENNRTRTGATDDDVLLTHINGAFMHIVNKLSDNAYWLRKRESLAISTAAGAVHTFEKKVWRVIRIERESDPTDYLRFQMIGYADGGKLQVVMQDRSGGTYTVHYVERPRELTRDDEKIPIPRVALEWLVAESCRRIARTTQNVQLQLQLSAEANTLHADVARHCAAMTRARNDRFHVQRRLRGRIGSHYGRYRWLLP